MTKTTSSSALAAALFALGLAAAPAQAFQLVTFVSGKGTDSGNCASPASPCRSFQFAIGQTTPGGEVKALDPAHYGGMVITKSISISGIEGAGINRVSGDAVTINAGPNDKINLSHLIIDGIGSGFGQNGIVLNSGGSLTVTRCVVRNFTNNGIFIRTTGNTRFLIGETLVTDNLHGIVVSPQGAAGSAQGSLDRVAMNKNRADGLAVFAGSKPGMSDVTSVESMASDNVGTGFVAHPASVLRLAHSTAAKNGVGIDANEPGTVQTYGDNYVYGNTQDFLGKLGPIATL